MCTPAELTAFKRKLARVDPVLANLIRAAGQFTHVPNEEHTPFHTLARAIAHQQLNGTAAESIFGRFVGLYSGEQAAALLEAELVLDTPDARLRACGLSFAKIAGIKDLARKTLDGTVPPYEILHTLEDQHIIDRITQVRGIGRWTVEMMLMFRMGRPDILPVDDFGVRNGFRLAYGLRGMPTPRALAEFGARWAPFRSVAAWYLWRAVELHKAGKLPAPAVKTRIKQVKKQAAVRRAKNTLKRARQVLARRARKK
jgi:DNA-3-methyladenine glycosylase II